jgi:hypothetical protein
MDMDAESFRSSINHKKRERRGKGSPWSKKALKADSNNDIHMCGFQDDEGCQRNKEKALVDRLCNLHVVDWKDALLPQYDRHRANHRRRTGEQLARNKAFGASKNHNSTAGGNGELVHRKRESFCNQSYTKCTFLDEYDKVLAMDCDGVVDIIRLGDLRDKWTDQRHQSVVSDLELGCVLPIKDFSTLYMEPLCGGSTVAVGTRDNNLFLLDLEQRSFLPTGQSSGPKARHMNCPRRYYYRDRYNPNLALPRLTAYCMNSDTKNEDCSELERIEYTSNGVFPNALCGRIPNQIRFVPHLQPSTSALWDVREFYKGCSDLIQVAHVDNDYDVFWMQILDHRLKKSNSPIVCVDHSSQDNPGTNEEHITSITLFSDVCLATAHICCPKFGLTSPRDFFDRDLTYSGQGMTTCIKIWDIRMLPSTFGCSSSTMAKPANIVTVPSFPQENAALLEPVECIQTHLTPKGKLSIGNPALSSSNATSNVTGGGDYVITNLEGSGGDDCGRGNNGSSNMGSLIATAQSRSRSSIVSHHKLDLGKRRVTYEASQTNESLGCHPIYDIAPSHDVMVCYSHKDGGGPLSCGRLEIHDFNKKKVPHASNQSAFRKKSFAEESCTTYKIEPTLLDRYGTETSLSCVAMNSNGTHILGGSTDGDLFIWRSC